MYRQRFPDDPGQHAEGQYTRTTYRNNPSFCERVYASLLAVIVGIALLTAASGLIFWNEGRAVQTAKSLQEALDLVIPLQTSEVALEQNNGKLVYLSGPLRTEGELQDGDYGMSVSAVKLRRKVEMYQWVEKKSEKQINEGEATRTETTYSYDRYWRIEAIRSSEFASPMGHHNPPEMAIKGMTYTAQSPAIGNFKLSERMSSRISNFRKLAVKDAPKGAQVYEGMVYHGTNPWDPQVGDMRLTFEYAGLSEGSSLGDPDVVSVIGKQDGSHLSEYQTEAGDALDLLHLGSFTERQMIGHEQAQNAFLCWALRLGGWLLMFIGFGCLTRIVVTIVDWIPIVRDLVNLGVMTFNAILSISLSITIIALGWLWYRPMLGGLLLCMAVLPFILSRRRAVDATNRQSYQYTRHREW